jgi:hypothetical protein
MNNSLFYLSLISEEDLKRIKLEEKIKSLRKQNSVLMKGIKKKNLCLPCIKNPKINNFFQKFPMNFLSSSTPEEEKTSLDTECSNNEHCREKVCSIHSPLCVKVTSDIDEVGKEYLFCSMNCANEVFEEKYGYNFLRISLFSRNGWKIERFNNSKFEVLRV